MKTLSMEHFAKSAPTVAFLHAFPGWVKTGIAREMPGFLGIFMRVAIGTFASLFLNIPPQRASAYSLYLATSARYPPKDTSCGNAGIACGDDAEIAVGIDGKIGSGMYTVNQNGDDCGTATYAALEPMRADGTAERVIEDLHGTWSRVLSN